MSFKIESVEPETAEDVIKEVKEIHVYRSN